MHRDRRAVLAAVAALYHVEGLSMLEIAEREHLSRSTVSRMLAQARERGIVEVTVHHTERRSDEVARDLQERYGVRAEVVQVPAGTSEVDRLEQVALRGAEHVRAVFGSDMTLVIPWGTTVAAVARHLVPRRTTGSRVVQLNGSGNTYSSGIAYASSIIDLFGAAFDASVHHFPVPAFFDDVATRRAMWRERSVQRVLQMQRHADVALSSVGNLGSEVPGHLYRSGYLERKDVERLAEQGVVGDVGSIFLRSDGTSTGIDLNERSSGMPLQQLRRIPRRILVATGHAKVPAVHAALLARTVTDLIIDHDAAVELTVMPAARRA
ncbi:MAG TPA: sugar-binding domain-containing protein [Cellulomonas sp.]